MLAGLFFRKVNMGRTREELHITGGNWFRAETIGYTINPNKTRSRISVGSEYKTCECGEVEENEWAAEYKAAVYEEGPETIRLFFDALEHAKTCAWLKSDKQREMYALEYLDRILDRKE